MHQSGHSRAHSMQTVQFSSNSPMTPRVRGGSSGWASGYCWVTVFRVIVRRVTARPLARPLPGIDRRGRPEGAAGAAGVWWSGDGRDMATGSPP